MSERSNQVMSGDRIRELLTELGQLLGPHGDDISIVIVGGSLMAIHGLRDGTTDVDTISAIDIELKGAIENLASTHWLASNWLNQSAMMFAPNTFEIALCNLEIHEGRLRVLSIPMRQLFLMKLNSNRRRDHEDLVLLWPRTGFVSADEVLQEFARAYPFAPEDEFLGEWVQQIINRATR